MAHRQRQAGLAIKFIRCLELRFVVVRAFCQPFNSAVNASSACVLRLAGQVIEFIRVVFQIVQFLFGRGLMKQFIWAAFSFPASRSFCMVRKTGCATHRQRACLDSADKSCECI